jgi:hypothetical protein
MGKQKINSKLLSKNLKQRNYLKDLGVKVRISEWIVEKHCVDVMWIKQDDA